MKASAKFVIGAAFACGISALAPNAASAMPVDPVGLAPATEEAHAVRVCSRGRCWWSHAGHYHGRYGSGWGRPYGWRHPHYGWRGGRHYGYGRHRW